MSAPSHAGVGPAIFCWLRSPGATYSSCAMLRWSAEFPRRLSESLKSELISRVSWGTRNGTLRAHPPVRPVQDAKGNKETAATPPAWLSKCEIT